MKRLITKSEFFDAIQKPGVKGIEALIEFYKNPTSKEIQSCKDGNDYHSIRGVILNDGTEYCWRGDILHLNVDSMINVEEFRFALEASGNWIFDAHQKYSLKEMYQMIVNYKDKLSKYGSVNGTMDIFFAIDSPKRCIAFTNIDEVQETLNQMK